MSGPDPRESPAGNDTGATEPFNELRSILLAPEQERLRQLQERLDDPRHRAEDLSGVLPEAIAIRARRDDRLLVSMRPVVSEAMRDSMRRDPKSFADALFPALGSAIRKAIAATLGEMVQSLNQVIENTFSVRGLKWRLEAMRTGRPFAEIVLLRSLVYRVEQVFLVHRETGLLLQHVESGAAAAKDADMASAMLTAIRDFARDTFDAGTEDSLNSLNIGDLTVWIEQGPHAIVAAVIRGTAPLSFKDVLRETVERIHLEQLEPLDDFQGDATPFEASRPALESCLVAQYAVPEQEASPVLKIATATLALVIVIALAMWAYAAWTWRGAVAALKSEPGIVVTEAERNWFGANLVEGLRDPLSKDPREILALHGYGSADVRLDLQPFASSDAGIVTKRAREVLQAPDAVEFAFDNGALSASGTAPSPWIARAREFAPFVAGVRSYSDERLLDTTAAAIRTEAERLRAVRIPFALGSAELVPEAAEVARSGAGILSALDTIARDAGGTLRIRIVGQADASGTDATNARISRLRAEAIALAVNTAQFRNLAFDLQGLGATPDSDRTVTFQVDESSLSPRKANQ
ncbi:MAG: OmpA family protein [Acidobacteria bacterium]|nr:OmpA family protein [Acidobacteriota bacterium]